MGFPIIEIPAEDEVALSPESVRTSEVYRAIVSINPDILIVELFWFPLDAFIRELPCRKVFLCRQVDPRFFRFRSPAREYEFRPSDYDLIVRSEPGFETPFPAMEINPLVIRSRDEILPEEAARKDLGLSPGERACLFAFNGKSGEGAEAWKSFDYLEREGWKVVRSDNREGGLFPAVDWFNAFDLVVCGAGVSAFWETRYFKKEAYWVPYPRQFEDQARRVALFSDYEFDENGADILARMIAGL